MKYVMVEYAGSERPGVFDGDAVLLLDATDLTEVICVREPQVFLQGGDVIVTRSDKLGSLRNRVTRA